MKTTSSNSTSWVDHRLKSSLNLDTQETFCRMIQEIYSWKKLSARSITHAVRACRTWRRKKFNYFRRIQPVHWQRKQREASPSIRKMVSIQPSSTTRSIIHLSLWLQPLSSQRRRENWSMGQRCIYKEPQHPLPSLPWDKKRNWSSITTICTWKRISYKGNIIVLHQMHWLTSLYQVTSS